MSGTPDTSVFKPRTIEQVADAVAWAVSDNAPLAVIGTGTKAGIGRAMQTRATLDLSAMSGITLYEPEELVMSAKAGTTRAEAEAVLAEKGQEFQFEPPDLSKLMGSAHAGTLGGMTASNLSGPRRIRSGAVRDHFLGFHGVSGRGEIFQSGSRVMKNVTGYDLPKVMAGSWGTLGVMADVTFKVLPVAETQTTIAIAGLDDAAAARAMSDALKSPADVSGAAHLPMSTAALSAVPVISGAHSSVTLLRLEGIASSVRFRTERLKSLLEGRGDLFELDAAASRAAWIEVRDVHFLAHDKDCLVWRISVPPMDGPGVMAAIRQTGDVTGYYDWGGGLIWLSVPVSEHASAQSIRGAFAMTSGHATLIRGPEPLRAALAVFDPPAPGLEQLSRRIKTGFDPSGILNPGRIYA